MGMRVALKSLPREKADTVACQLAMALMLLDDDPAAAHAYAQAAVHRAGRVGVVREIAGLAAYRAGDWATALRDLRAHRRITGDQTNLAIIADAERGRGRPQEAIQLAEEADLAELPTATRVELAIVVSGAWRDQGDLDRARKALEIPELDPDTAYAFSARLFEAYADVLKTLGDPAARDWAVRAGVAEQAWARREGGDLDDDAEFSIRDLGEIIE